MKDLLLTALMASLLAASAGSLRAENASSDEAEKTIQVHLQKLKGAENARLSRIQEASFAKSFKALDFFVLRFRRYPSEIVPPPPLKPNNLFAVSGGQVTHIVDEKGLERFFKKHLLKAESEEAKSSATTNWLYLVQELHKDGFFEFDKPAVDLRGSTCEGVVHVVRQRGDVGELTVQLAFDGGSLQTVRAGGKVIAGIRPRCQATRLLHEDPVIREIMRQDILVMGRSCKSYLDEVRATASPELQRAIDEVWRAILAAERGDEPRP